MTFRPVRPVRQGAENKKAARQLTGRLRSYRREFETKAPLNRAA